MQADKPWATAALLGVHNFPAQPSSATYKGQRDKLDTTPIVYGIYQAPSAKYPIASYVVVKILPNASRIGWIPGHHEYDISNTERYKQLLILLGE